MISLQGRVDNYIILDNERYSYIGSNRVSLTVNLSGTEGKYYLSIITSGGSQAVFFKINTWGEASFLDSIREIVNKLGD